MSAKIEPQDGQTKRAVQGLKSENLTAMISRGSRQQGQFSLRPPRATDITILAREGQSV
jgi:hypothetical protein